MRFSFHVIMVSILKWLFLVLSDRIPGVTTITSGTRLFISRGTPTDFSQMKNKGVVSNYYGTSFCWSIMNKHILFYSLYQSITLIRKLFWYPKLKNKKTKKTTGNRIFFVSRKSLGFIYSWPDTISKKCSFEQEMTHIHRGALECHPGFSYHCEIKNALKCSAAFRLMRERERRKGSWKKVGDVERKGVTTHVSEKERGKIDKLSNRMGGLLGLRLLDPSGWIHFERYSKRSLLAKWRLRRNGQESAKSWILRNDWI